MASYKIIYTKIGLQLFSQAMTTGIPVELSDFAIGDGGGTNVIPNAEMKTLVRQRYRAAINRIYQDPEFENQFIAELIVPLDVEGFVQRELGIFDKNNNLVMIGNLPEVIKPVAADGVFTDTVYRVPFIVSNISTVELKINPNTAIATQSWIVNTLTPAYFFPGGTTGQVLKKQTNKDGDVIWSDAAAADVFVNTIQEEQSLITDQTVVDLTKVTTTGIAVYISGLRITQKSGTDGFVINSATRITLGKAYASAKILIVQNEPQGSAPYPLAQSKNLSDIENKTVARKNLNVFSKEESKSNGLPPGAIVYFAMNKAPNGFLKVNGAAISRVTYADLFAEIGTMYGAGDGVNTFNLPDGRAEFPRGLDDGRGIDIGRVIGSKQQQQVLKHKHLSFGEAYNGGWIFGNSVSNGHMGNNGGLDYDNYLYYTNDGTEYKGENPNASGVIGDENRPRNIAWLCCIKY